MTQIESIEKFVTDWYSVGKNIIPEFGSREFGTFAGAAASFVFQVAPKAPTVSVKFSSSDDIAYVDMMKYEIYLGKKVFTKEFYFETFGSTDIPLNELAVAILNGLIIHEALHLRHTPRRDGMWDIIRGSITSSDWNKLKSLEKRVGRKVILSVFNILEDAYIERRTPKSLVNWIENLWEVMFPTSRMDLTMTQPLGIAKLVNTLCLWKNGLRRDHPLFEVLGKEILKEANSLVENEFDLPPHERIHATVEIVRLIEELLKDGKESEGSEGEGSKGEGSEGEDSKGQSEGFEIDVNGGELKELLGKLGEPSDEALEEMAEAISDVVEGIVESESDFETYGVGGSKVEFVPKVRERDVFDAIRGDAPVYPKGEIDAKFVKELKAIRTQMNVPGQARTSGGRLRKQQLTRITTDGKIFAKQDSQKRINERLEIILLIDLSASTSGKVISNELGAAFSLSDALRRARVAHAVYGQTTLDWKVPVLYHLWSYDMKVTNMDVKDRQKATRIIDLQNNADGFVIDLVSTKFTGKPAQKYLICLSDGMPDSSGYWGHAAAEHTKQIIEEVRGRGIVVFALSVVADCVEGNNKLYGKDFNIDASAGIIPQIKRLVKSIA